MILPARLTRFADGLSTARLIGVGFAFSIAIIVVLGSTLLFQFRALGASFDAFSRSTDTSHSVEAHVENLFGARVAALKFRNSGDATQVPVVAEKFNSVLAETDSAHARDDEMVSFEEQLRTGALAYLDSFNTLVEVTETNEGYLEHFTLQIAEITSSLSSIQQSANQANQVTAAYTSAGILEQVLMARLAMQDFYRTADPARLEEVRDNLSAAKSAGTTLMFRLPTPEDRAAATAVQDAIDLLPFIVDEIGAGVTRVRSIGRDQLDVIGGELQQAAQFQLERIVAEQVILQNRADALRVQTLIIVAVGVAVAAVALILGAIMIGQLASNRLDRLARTTAALSEGDLEIDIQGDEYEHEIGVMARALRVFREAEQERRAAASENAALQAQTERVVGELGTSLGQLADGNLSTRMTTPFAAQFEPLRRNFNEAMSRLDAAIGAVAERSSDIRMGTDQLTSSADDLAERTEKQGHAVAEIGRTVGDMEQALIQTSDTVTSAEQFANEARGKAENGRDVVGSTVAAMDRIKTSSGKIRDISSVIDDIAFQTNLLALNAGVEAARAGDAGRGFAVVASEVRALAQRSAEAAGQISELIVASAGEVEEGVRQADGTASALSDIVEMVEKFDGLMASIGTAARQQSNDLSEITATVRQVDDLTQSNAAMVEETNAACHQLKTEADQLTKSVAAFEHGDSASVPADGDGGEASNPDAELSDAA